jgi:hypothetical protein
MYLGNLNLAKIGKCPRSIDGFLPKWLGYTPKVHEEIFMQNILWWYVKVERLEMNDMISVQEGNSLQGITAFIIRNCKNFEDKLTAISCNAQSKTSPTSTNSGSVDSLQRWVTENVHPECSMNSMTGTVSSARSASEFRNAKLRVVTFFIAMTVTVLISRRFDFC